MSHHESLPIFSDCCGTVINFAITAWRERAGETHAGSTNDAAARALSILIESESGSSFLD
jgi:hypothetical protein